MLTPSVASLVDGKEDLFKMEKKKRILLVGFFLNLIIFFLFINSVGAGTRVYYGQVVGIEFSLLQVRAEDGRVSVFWCGYKTFVDSRPPLIGDKVKIEYIKDSIKRNAVTRIAVLN
jgi:hypothetical protein